MRTLIRLVRCLFVLIIMIGLAACAGLGSDSVTIAAPTQAVVIPVKKPAIVNADTIPVRRGPGVEYAQATTLSRNYDISVIGQSGDGKWYKVEIPGYVGDQSSLWIAVDFVTIITPTEIVTVTVIMSSTSPTLVETITTQVLNPSPSETLQLPTSSCEPPAGWVLYIVQPRDTLLGLAVKTNTFVDQLMLANCLTSSQVATGSRLYLPFVPPTDTLLPFPSSALTPTNTATTSPTPRPIDTLTSTDTPRPIDTLTSTSTATITPRPIETVTLTDTSVVSPAAPTPGTPNP
jgi:hypothetical protein